VKVSWADFQQRHVLDPAEEPDYRNWKRAEWNVFLKNRIPNYGEKEVNSFIIGKPTAILADFKDGYYQYTQVHYVQFISPFSVPTLPASRFCPLIPQHDGTGNGNAKNLHWASTKFEVFVLIKAARVSETLSSYYNVHACPSEFVLAGFDEANIQPIHYQAQSTSRRTSGQLELNLSECSLIGGPIDSENGSGGGHQGPPTLIPIGVLLVMMFKLI